MDMRDLKDVRLNHSLVFVENKINNIKIDDAFPLFCSIGCLVTHMKKIGKMDSKSLSTIVKIVCEYLRCPADNVVVAALYLLSYIYTACPGYLSHKDVEYVMKSVENITTISQVSLLTPVAHVLRNIIVCTKDPKGELVTTCLDWYNRVYSNRKHHPLTEMACFCLKYYIEKMAHDPPAAKYLNSTWKSIQNFFQAVWPKQNTPEQFWIVKCVLIGEYLMGKKYVSRNLIIPVQGMAGMDSFDKNLRRKIEQEEKSYDLYMDSNAASWTDKNYHGGHPKHYTQDVQNDNYPHFNDFTATLIDASAQQELMKSGAEKASKQSRSKKRRRVIPTKYGKKALGVVGKSIDVEELEIEMEENDIDIEDDRRSTHTMKTAVSRMMGLDMLDEDEDDTDTGLLLSENSSDLNMGEGGNGTGGGGVGGTGGVDYYVNTLDLYDEFGNYRGDKVDQLKKEREREQIIANERKANLQLEEEKKNLNAATEIDFPLPMDNNYNNNDNNNNNNGMPADAFRNKDKVVMIDDTIFTMQENPYVVHTLKECLSDKPVFEWCYNDLYQWLLSLKLPGLNKFNLKKYFYDYITCNHFLNLLRCNEQQLLINLLESQIYWPDDFRSSLWTSARLFWDLWFLAIIKKKIGETVREYEQLKDERNSLIHELKDVFEIDDTNDTSGKKIFDDAFVKDEVHKYVLKRYPDAVRWNASNSIQILKEIKVMQDRYFHTLKARKEWNDSILQQQIYRQDLSSIQLRIRKRVRELDEITRTITSHELQLREYEVQQKHYESLYHTKLEEYAAVIVSKYHYTDQKFNKPNLYFMTHLENLKEINGHFKKQEKRLDRLIRRLEEMQTKLRKCQDHQDFKSKSDMEMLRRNFPLLMNTYFNDVQFLSVLSEDKKKKRKEKRKRAKERAKRNPSKSVKPMYLDAMSILEANKPKPVREEEEDDDAQLVVVRKEDDEEEDRTTNEDDTGGEDDDTGGDDDDGDNDDDDDDNNNNSSNNNNNNNNNDDENNGDETEAESEDRERQQVLPRHEQGRLAMDPAGTAEHLAQVLNLADGKAQTLQKIEQMFNVKSKEMLEEFLKGRTPYQGIKKITDVIREEQYNDRYGYKDKLKSASGTGAADSSAAKDDSEHKEASRKDYDEDERSDDMGVGSGHVSSLEGEKDDKLQMILQRIKDSIEKYAKDHGISMDTKVEVGIKPKVSADSNIEIQIQEEKQVADEAKVEAIARPRRPTVTRVPVTISTTATSTASASASVSASASASVSASVGAGAASTSASAATTQSEAEEKKAVDEMFSLDTKPSDKKPDAPPEAEKKEEVKPAVDENIVLDPETGQKFDMRTIDTLDIDPMKKAELNVLWRNQKKLARKARLTLKIG
ncbi:Nucleolar protein Nop52 [Reticulomyxa filosa]|uniref:Nucleolar protein Nop52 n=1 Tax=Reticulomyxa filosa TaxID=46433 RepID=X6M037_RETFI|nr:Nucleolar protein Nop52 [Reticulomyxa filosa]|eukprot:ETO06946.1 Nucleolar protein Nop52 [Reticulomyxa filosa]